jgi:hypothetical protein
MNCINNQITKQGDFGMKRLMVSLGIVLVGIVFCAAPSYAECPLTQLAPYTTVIKYVPGKTKVIQMWECTEVEADYAFVEGGVCFKNYLDNANSYQRICITGDIKVVFPPSMNN